MLEALLPKGMALSRKKIQGELVEGEQEKELEGTQTILRKESPSLVRTIDCVMAVTSGAN